MSFVRVPKIPVRPFAAGASNKIAIADDDGIHVHKVHCTTVFFSLVMCLNLLCTKFVYTFSMFVRMCVRCLYMQTDSTNSTRRAHSWPWIDFFSTSRHSAHFILSVRQNNSHMHGLYTSYNIIYTRISSRTNCREPVVGCCADMFCCRRHLKQRRNAKEMIEGLRNIYNILYFCLNKDNKSTRKTRKLNTKHVLIVVIYSANVNEVNVSICLSLVVVGQTFQI